MKKKNLEELNTEELLKQEKALKFITGLLIGMIIVLFALIISKSIKDKKFDPLIASPIALSAIIPLNLKKIKDIRSEINKR